jgi:putative transposase
VRGFTCEVYGAEVPGQTITVITDRVMEGLAERQSRPLDSVYAVFSWGAYPGEPDIFLI